MITRLLLYGWIAILSIGVTAEPRPDVAPDILGAERIIHELRKYYVSFDQPTLLSLEYIRVSTSPPLPHEEAVKLAEKRILGAEIHFQGERLKEEIARIKQSASHQDLVAMLEAGWCSTPKTEILTFSKQFIRRTVSNEDGNVFYKSYGDGKTITRRCEDPNLPVEQRFTTVQGPSSKVKDEMCLFAWHHLLHDEQSSSTYQQLENGMHRLHTQHTGGKADYDIVLDGRFQEGFFVPVKYTLMPHKVHATTTLHYRDYRPVSGLPVPSLVLRQERPKEKAEGLTAIIGPLDVYYVLQKR